MKKVLLFLMLGTIYVTSFSQSRKEIVFKIQQGKIEVYLLDSSLIVECQTLNYFDWFPRKREIYMEQRNHYLHGEKQVYALFLNLYNWINEIEESAGNLRIDGNVHWMKFVDSNEHHYMLFRGHESFINILSYYEATTEGNYYVRMSKKRWHKLGAKWDFKTITEFKKRLLDYTSSHNINLTL